MALLSGSSCFLSSARHARPWRKGEARIAATVYAGQIAFFDGVKLSARDESAKSQVGGHIRSTYPVNDRIGTTDMAPNLGFRALITRTQLDAVRKAAVNRENERFRS